MVEHTFWYYFGFCFAFLGPIMGALVVGMFWYFVGDTYVTLKGIERNTRPATDDPRIACIPWHRL